MKIILFYFWELGALGGVEVNVLTLAAGFGQRGCSTGIIEMAPDRKPMRFLSNQVPVWGITSSSFPSYYRPRSWVSFLRATMQFQKIVREFDPDVVHVHFPLGQSLPVVGAHILPHRWRLVVTVHNSDIRISPFAEPQLRRWQARLFERANAVTAVSQCLLDETVNLYGCVRGKAQVVHNGVGPMWFRNSLGNERIEEKYVLFVGRLNQVKGLDVLFAAWAQVHPHIAGTNLWIAGDGPDIENLRGLARKLEISSSVRFLGRIRQEDLPSLYKNSEMVVLPSRREGLPLTLLEAGACGAICIGTDISGICEVIDNEITGFLVEPGSVDALVRAILGVVQLPFDKKGRMIESARKKIWEHFSEEQMISSYLQLFESMSQQP